MKRWTRLRGRNVKLMVVCLGAIVLLALGLRAVLMGGGWGFSVKTIWDWLELFIIPIVLGVGALLFNRAERKADRENTLDRQREAALTTYLDRMSDLLLGHKLRISDQESEARTVAVARTKSVLRNLHGPRLVEVIQFLTASGLGGTKLLRIDMRGADLPGADLRGADLEGADLRGANLLRAWLAGANLGGALLTGADLGGALLIETDLRGADLTYADLQWTYFLEADLTGATVTPEQITANPEADTLLIDATMPDGTKYEDWLARGRPDWTQKTD